MRDTSFDTNALQRHEMFKAHGLINLYMEDKNEESEYPHRLGTSGWHYAHWARAISSWSRQGKQVFCYIDNDERDFALQNDAKLRNMLQNG